MQSNHWIGGVAVATSLFAAIACGGGDEKAAVPPAEVQSQAVRPTNQPMTVNGCLKAGDAPDTFVVTAARTAGSNDTATYQLVGGQGVKLTDHIGHAVEVSGTVRETQELESRARADAPQPEATTGAGKPVVETRTEVEIKRLEVSEIKPTGEKCE